MKIAVGAKAFGVLALGCVISQASSAEVNVDPYGYLTTKYDSNPNLSGFNARSGARFSIADTGFGFGLGAIGAWSIPMKSEQESSSTGDISDAYISYTRSVNAGSGAKHKETLQARVGRFNSDFMNSDWVMGNIQGIAAKYSISNRFDVYAMYMNSYLNTSYKKGQVGAMYGTSIATLNPFVRDTKDNLVGGEVFMGGFSYTNDKSVLLDIWGLINIKYAGNVDVYNSNSLLTSTKKQSALAQAGLTASFKTNFSASFKSKTTFRGIFQYGNTDGRDLSGKTGQDIDVLLWGDEKITIMDDFYVGAGAHYVIGREGTGGIWSVSDKTRYYGNTMGLGGRVSGGIAPYFYSDTLTAYLYGGIDYKDIKLHALASFIDYQEFSLMASYAFWKQQNMQLELGGGFVSYKALNYVALYRGAQTKTSQKVSSDNFNIFVRFSY